MQEFQVRPTPIPTRRRVPPLSDVTRVGKRTGTCTPPKVEWVTVTTVSLIGTCAHKLVPKFVYEYGGTSVVVVNFKSKKNFLRINKLNLFCSLHRSRFFWGPSNLRCRSNGETRVLFGDPVPPLSPGHSGPSNGPSATEVWVQVSKDHRRGRWSEGWRSRGFLGRGGTCFVSVGGDSIPVSRYL